MSSLVMQPSVMPSQDELWQSLFKDYTLWYDKRPTVNGRPDFVHKQHHFSLWLNKWTPKWALEGVTEADELIAVPWEKVHIYLCKQLAVFAPPHACCSLRMR